MVSLGIRADDIPESPGGQLVVGAGVREGTQSVIRVGRKGNRMFDILVICIVELIRQITPVIRAQISRAHQGSSPSTEYTPCIHIGREEQSPD